jgi:hypothetical protein
MFKSKQRPIVVPQWEHGKLAGTLALLWGNAEFAPPPVPPDSFLAGIALHDRAYGHLDNLPIGEMTEATWFEVARRGFTTVWADPMADMIAKLHIQRLMSYGQTPARQALAAEMATAIAAQIEQHGLSAELLARIDRITRLCDDIAFNFCFEVPAEGAVEVFPQWEGERTVTVQHRVANGVITVDPWPFRVDSHTGYLVGYQREGYPEVLEPVMLRYTLLQGKAA